MDLDLAPHTLHVFEEACEAVGLDPDSVRSGDHPIRVEADDVGALLEVLAPEADVPASHVEQAAGAAARVWFSVAMQKIQRAAERASEQAEAVGVLEVMEQRVGSDKPLQRVLTGMEPGHFDRVWYAWDIERALTYLMLRSVDHVSENLDEYI